MISIQQMKAARALLEWEQRDVADHTGLSVPTIQRMESLGLGRSSHANATKVQKAFEEAGIEFLDDDAPGVRLHPRPARARKPKAVAAEGAKKRASKPVSRSWQGAASAQAETWSVA